MTDITNAQVRQAIDDFLAFQFQRKAEKELKALAKATEDNDTAKIAELNEILQPIKDKYAKDTWITYAGDWMSKQLSFGTHISKGIHSSSKGDNLIFDVKKQNDFVGHHTLNSPVVDASGNAAALPLSAFLNFSVIDDISIGELVLKKHPSVTGVFHSDAIESDRLQSNFYQVVLSQVGKPKTDERNKQILWATEDDYICLVPLYPVSVTNHLYNQVQTLRFSDKHTLARKNRSKVNEIQKSYPTLQNLAVVNIGGSNPQGVSQLMSKQGGRNYLLPSTPPTFTGAKDLSIAKSARSLFDVRSLNFLLKEPLDSLFDNINIQHNTVHIRDGRKAIIDFILFKIMQIAISIQDTRPAGWSKDYELNMAQKYWLDPKRGELDGEEDFQSERDKGDWKTDLERQFADWLQGVLRQKFKAIAQDFSDAEHKEWLREMQDTIKQSERAGQGAFR